MDAEFWQDKWLDNKIGFHQSRVNTRLQHWWPRFELAAGSGVFVPLCGKSTDMLWLHGEGHQVVGSELSEIAARDFFADNELVCEREVHPRYVRYRGRDAAEGLSILCGDYFSLRPDDCAPVAAFYDRAALIAMPENLRGRYVAQLAALMPLETPGLMLTIDYDQTRMAGPPFAVSDEQARHLLEPCFSVDELETSSGAERLGNLKDRGLDSMVEHVYRLSLRQSDTVANSRD